MSSSPTNEPRVHRGVPGGGQYTAHRRPETDAPALRLPPSPAAVAKVAQRHRLATAPKQEPSYRVELPALPTREVRLGRGSALDHFAAQYPDMDVWTVDGGAITDFDPRTATADTLGEYSRVISTGYDR
ncbi:hypothetical protein [Curtobacterium sp. MCBD17_040]|uniref:hypothetical protein n=1 Tax=Curtobacterium sp. MCBD17_040 TaxID=2175674 RepID=UPI000DA91815|nr:hypothetical protein [Curtobacterium sp. MCBD17_040]WIB65331.1 hypothetical protein DEI94_18160 [Curtobacterium sp. MCBD17_040]